jgi:hypothetical protein
MAKLFGSRRRAELTVRADQCPAKALSFGEILNNHQTFRRLDAGRGGATLTIGCARQSSSTAASIMSLNSSR